MFACASSCARSCFACASCEFACAKAAMPEVACAKTGKIIKAKLQHFAQVRILKMGSLVLRIFYLQGPDPRRFEEKIDDDEWR